MTNHLLKNIEVKYNKNTPYAITIQPDDKHQYFRSPTRMDKFKNYINEFLLSLPTVKIDYYFVIELSEPIGTVTSQGPRLHAHGVIYMNSNHSVYKFLLDIMPIWLTSARLEISKLNDVSYWVNYIHKQQHIFKKTKPLSNYVDPIIDASGRIRSVDEDHVNGGGEPL